MSNKKRIQSLKDSYHFIQEKWDHLVTTTPEERKFLNEELLREWWTSYVDSGNLDVYYFTVHPTRLQHYLSADTMNYLGVGSNYHTMSQKINEFCAISQDFIDEALTYSIQDWNNKLSKSPDLYVLYQMMKFLKLSEDIRERGVIMPLQFHKHYQGYKAHPGSDKQSSILLNSDILTDPIPCFYIHYKEYVDTIEIKDVDNLIRIKTADKFMSLFPFWDHESFILAGSLIEVDKNGILNDNFNQHMLPFAEGMVSYLKKNNKDYKFSEIYISYLDAVHRRELIFKSESDIKDTLSRVKKISECTFMLGDYKFKNHYYNSYDNPQRKDIDPLWLPENLVQYPKSLVDVDFKSQDHNPQLKRKKLSHESVYRV